MITTLHGEGRTLSYDGHCVESARPTCCIVGRDWGLTRKHANANFTTATTSSAT